MRKIFADTGYWIALLNPDDSLHTKAREISVRWEDIFELAMIVAPILANSHILNQEYFENV